MSIYTLSHYEKAPTAAGVTTLAHCITPTNTTIRVAVAYNSRSFPIHAALSKIPLGTKFTAELVKDSKGYPTFEPQSIQPLTTQLAHPTELDIVNLLAGVSSFGTNPYLREAPLNLPGQNTKFIDLLALYPKRVDAIEVKNHCITAEDIHNKLQTAKYHLCLSHTYPRPVQNLTFTSPYGITPEARVSIKQVPADHTTIKYLTTQTLLANLVQQVFNSRAATDHWFIAKQLTTFISAAPLDTTLAHEIIANYYSVSTLLEN